MNGEDKSEAKLYEMIPKPNLRISGHSTPGLLMRSVTGDRTGHKDNADNRSVVTSFMYLTESGQIQISDFSHNFKKYYSSGCNGFMLESFSSLRHSDYWEFQGLRITNPATNQQLRLPPFPNPDPIQPFVTSFALAYDSTRMEYKVVYTYSTPHAFPCFQAENVRMHCGILTVGVDNAWRVVETQHLSLESSRQLKMRPLTTEGFVHWVLQDLFSTGKGFVLTLNVETETMTRYIAPRCVSGFHYYKYLSTGERNLSLLIARGYFKWNVWDMNSETGKWTKLFDIDLGGHAALFNESCDRGDHDLGCRLFPVGWLKYRTVIVFVVDRVRRDNSTSLSSSRVVYNVEKRDVTVLRLDRKYFPSDLFHRDNQLIIHGMQD